MIIDMSPACKAEQAKVKKRLYSRAYHGEETRQFNAGEPLNKVLCRQAGAAACAVIVE